MAQYTITALDPLFTTQFDKKLEQYHVLACLPTGLCEQLAVIQYTLQLLQKIDPVLGRVLDAELAAGNAVRTACCWGSGGLLDITLVDFFGQRYKGRHLAHLVVKDAHYEAAYSYQQYTCAAAPEQRLLSRIRS